MALSMDEQRMLDEIERRLADEDPVLAARLTAFGPAGLTATLRSRRGRMLASLIALITLAVISAAAYAIMPFGLRHSVRPRPAPAAPTVVSHAGAGSQGTGSRLPASGSPVTHKSLSGSHPVASMPQKP